MLQETHTNLDDESKWKQQWGGPCFFSYGTDNSRGCCILIRNNIDFKPCSIKSDRNGRYIITQCTIDDDPFILGNIYTPNAESDQLTFYDSLKKAMLGMGVTSLEEIIIGGDWNVIRDIQLDKQGGTQNANINQSIA